MLALPKAWVYGQPKPTPRSTADAVFVGAGDIGHGQLAGAKATGKLLDDINGAVFALGDCAYPSGTTAHFSDYYDPHWGRHKSRTYPCPGNHDYDRSEAAAYFSYFGSRASTGYYRFALGAWDLYSINSNVAANEGSAQYRWLAAELDAHPSPHTLGYWHHPVRTSGKNGDQPQMLPIWRLLARHGADVILSAHDHAYERFAPMDADLRADPRGMRLFVVGTGGGQPYTFDDPKPLSEKRIVSWGVLKLTLRADGYAWEFIPVPGGNTDTGKVVRGPIH